MRDAKASLKGHWGAAALATLVYTLIVLASGALMVGPLLVTGPMSLGFIKYLRQVKAGQSPKLDAIFSGFEDFSRSFVAYLLMTLFLILWMFLLYIPAIIKAFAYAMTFNILADPDFDGISARQAIRISDRMMKGYKMKLFGLYLRYFGWALLCGLTFGILAFWIQPYMSLAQINFYEDVKADYMARQGGQPAC
jgi:uncharacterized membrane protein